MSVPDVTLLFQDLLSPATTLLESTTPALITYHLSTLPATSSTQLVTSLVRYVATSPALWRGQAQYAEGWHPLNWTRGREVYDAVKNGLLYRVGELSTEVGTGWRARRRLSQYLDSLYAGLALEYLHPTIRLLLVSAVLKGLQLVKLRKDKLYVGGTAHLGRAETQSLLAWEGYFEAVQSQLWLSNRSGNPSAPVQDILPPWLAADTLAIFSVDALKTGPLPSLLGLLVETYSQTFISGQLFASLASDLSPTPAGLHWNVPSPSHTTFASIISSPLFIALGPLSRAVGRCIEAAGKAKDDEAIAAVRTSMDRCARLSQQLNLGWARSGWCDAEEELDEETRKLNLPWSVLKSYLFALTMMQSSLLILLSPLPSVEPTRLQLEMSAQSLKILGSTYFITSKFGSQGFSAWQGVWTGLLQIVGNDDDQVARVMGELEPKEKKLHVSSVDRSVATFYLNVAEQLMKQMDSKYVETVVLPVCHPYLINPKYRDTFESAHSVLLAIFASEKDCANELAPWYTSLLLQAYPALMSASQLRLAFTTMIRCVSASDDALAWFCILQLIAAIKAIPLNPPSPTRPDVPTSTNAATLPVDESASSREFDEESSTTRLDEAAVLSPVEASALKLQRGHLLLTLIDQTTAVNLILLRTLLGQIWEFVNEEKAAGDDEGKNALVKVVFNTLGEGLDATKRDEGVRYWMEKREELA